MDWWSLDQSQLDVGKRQFHQSLDNHSIEYSKDYILNKIAKNRTEVENHILSRRKESILNNNIMQ